MSEPCLDMFRLASVFHLVALHHGYRRIFATFGLNGMLKELAIPG